MTELYQTLWLCGCCVLAHLSVGGGVGAGGGDQWEPHKDAGRTMVDSSSLPVEVRGTNTPLQDADQAGAGAGHLPEEAQSANALFQDVDQASVGDEPFQQEAQGANTLLQDAGLTGVGAGPLPEEARSANTLLQAGPCSMLSNLQDAVLQVMTVHSEYGHGIHRLHGIVGQLQIDLNDLKAQLLVLEQKGLGGEGEEVEKGEKKVAWQTVGKHQPKTDQRPHHHYRHHRRHHHSVEKGDDRSTSSSGTRHHPEPKRAMEPEGLSQEENYFKVGVEQLATFRAEAEVSHHKVLPYHKDLLDAVDRFMGGYFNSSLYTERLPTFSVLVHNVSEQLEHHGSRLTALHRKLHGVRRQVKQAANTLVTWEKTLKLYDSQMLSHMLEKQGEMNTALEQRVVNLEESVKVQAALLRDQSRHSQPGNSDQGCPSEFVRHATSCYLFVNQTAHWVDAEKYCQGRHGKAHLVAIETQGEHDFIVMYRQYNGAHWSSYYVWTGGTNMLESGGWRWVSTQRPLTYTRWRAGKPSAKGHGEQHCLYFPTVGGDLQWDDWHCYAARLNYVCEIQV